MRRRRVWHCQNIYEIPLGFFQSNGFKGVLLDLDNTLDNPYRKKASSKAKEKIRELRDAGLFVAIVSNNTDKRIKNYLGDVTIDGFLSSSKKPSPARINGFLKAEGLDPASVVMIGDQVFTDYLASQRCDLAFILTERLSRRELPWTYFNRFKEVFVRRKWQREGRFGERIK